MRNLLRLAVRSLGRNRRRSLITLLAVSIGVALVVFAYGIGGGLAGFLVSQVVDSRTGAIQVHKRGYRDAQEAAPLDLTLPYDEAFVARLAGVEGVTAVSGRLLFSGLLTNGRISSMVMVQGLDPAREDAVTPARKGELLPGDGTWLRAEEETGAVLGRQLSKSLESGLGDLLTLTAAGPGGAMNALDLEVAGIVTGGVVFESKRAVSVPLAYAQTLLGMEGKVTEYALQVDDLARVDEVKARLQAALGPDVEVSSWADVQPFIRDMANRIRVVLRGVSFVLFAIVVLGVINTMLMSVYERVREIGTLLALGVRRRQVLLLFLIEALLLGLVGGVVGASLGYLVTSFLGARGIAFRPPGGSLEQVLSPVADLGIACLAATAAVVGALLAAAWPARKASLMNPVDALRS